MKTQLLQDIQDSGAGRAARASTSQPAEAPSDAFPHTPDAAVRESPSAAPDPPPAAGAGADVGATAAMPDWLAERLREDAAQAERAERRTRWQRRAVAAGIAAGVLAVLAAGGLWLVQENRVDGALVVVANTTPTVATSAADSAGAADARDARSATVEPAVAPHAEPPRGMAPDVAQAASASTSHVDAPRASPASDASAVPDAAPTALAPPAIRDAAAAASQASPSISQPNRSATASAAPATASAAPATAAPRPARAAPRVRTADAAASTSRHRREETLMQCRAHGYDERQCRLRACAMTRFGLACRG